ncbi:MAG: glycosyltransferase family 2 protein, partial [Bacteroidia bacterium]
MQKSIDILLSTYNSEKHLESQINSLFNQTYTLWNLLIRDDGSTDGTLEYLKNLQIKYPEKIKLFVENKNVGVIKSFEYLLTYSNASYIMFCDHDDVWLPNKIEITFSKMQELENEFPNLPILVHTDLTVVNNNFQKIHDSFWKFSKLNPQLLSNFNYLGVCNGITGCTMLINRKAIDISLPISPNATMHDSWIGLCVSKLGKTGYVNNSTILYRQHASNQIGATEIKGTFNYVNSRIQNFKSV